MSVTVHGYLGSPSADLREHAARADVVVGGRRHLDALAVPEDRRIVLGSLSSAMVALRALPADTDVLVVASGDPGFYGVVRRLRGEGFRPRVVPTVSSVAMAFAAVGLPWDDAQVASAHGHPLEPTLYACRTWPKVAVLTAPDQGIRELAAAVPDRVFVLAERLGEVDERVRILTREQALALPDVTEPNVVLVLADHPDADSMTGESPALVGMTSKEPR
ncbi:precorrin-6Y C5,15-methyltransferase (decarboxylating) [Raineyella antarctica]|uniref:Precorrin-6Y C5,15-methyltransferase (Decarboxylating) n=1 Tax=Raineyella antarctica TaxID=1577474 RepID=A0A1G6GD64_9ACTN|nr:precorrin-6y C5,15-methyltransferase (decarboxylating) subunit CbiE [Raineyella antarctica]SDB79937.1 precorrin-6Y C5,15-methyltransferase (decarboxylating) [Raineyella antarctica]